MSQAMCVGGLMADEMMPWFRGGSWTWHIPPRLSYTLDMYGRFSHPKARLYSFNMHCTS